MLNYARSGGTLLNKCLASLPNVVMLSEINPLGCGSGYDINNPTSSIKNQVKNWYNIDLKDANFKNQIKELYDYCKKNDKVLIIRDWSFVNFSNFEKYNYNNPPKKFLILEELQEYDLKIFGFVRNSIDIWLSRGCPDIKIFFSEYTTYINSLLETGCPIFKYEDFVNSPKKQLELICQKIGVDYVDVFETCLDYEKVNGDVQNKKNSRGIKQGEIKLLPRKQINSEKIAELNKCEKMKKINIKFNYTPSFYDSYFMNNIVVPFKNFVKKI